MITPWRRGVARAHVLDDALSALTAADWTAAQPPVAWMHWPVDLANPYQALLYSRFPRHNLVPIRIFDRGLIDRLIDNLPADIVKVLHLHWLYAVTAGSRSSAGADERVARFEDDLMALRERGVILVWTVHNLLPHETIHPGAERRLRRWMVDTVDLVHVMHDSHVAVLRDVFAAEPRAVVTVPHPSFVGAYPDWVDRAAARAQLGIPQGARVLTTFGQIRPYKGHDTFFAVLDEASRLDPTLRWLVAGKIRDEPGGAAFSRRAVGHPAVLFHPGFAPDVDVQFYLRAADAAVFPYRTSLNSGAVALAASFDLPAYASTGTRLGGLLPDDAVVRFDLDEPRQAARTLADRALESDRVRAAVRRHARALRPAVVSEQLAAAVRAHLGHLPRGGPDAVPADRPVAVG